MRGSDEPVLIINPRSDGGFAALVHALAGDTRSPAELQAALRQHHPAAVVRPRALNGEHETWYVYRDGHWVPSGRPGEEESA